MKYSAFLVLGALVALVGCGDDRPATRTDGGTTIMLMDGGGGGGTDSGGGGGTDSGMMMMGRACEQPLDVYPAMAAERCSAATLTCLNACTTSACITGCVDMDTTPPLTDPSDPTLMIDCSFCLGYNQFYCLDSRGSHTEVAAYFCCVEDNCPTGSASTCPQTSCASELTALQGSLAVGTCASGPPTTGDYAVCFPAM